MDSKNGKIYALSWSPYGIFELKITNTSSLTTYITKETIISPMGIAVDKSAGKIYWSDEYSTRIQRANTDGSNIETLIIGSNLAFGGVSTPEGLALDLTNRHIYWADRGTNLIKRANLDGTSIQNIINFNTQTNSTIFPGGLALDVPNKKLYYTAQGATGLYRANLDGTGVENLFRAFANFPDQIALDLENKKLYWSEDRIGLMKANLDGTQRDTFYKKQYRRDGGLALDVTNKKIYWIIDSVLQKVNFDGTNPVDLINNIPLQSGFGGYMTWGASHSYVSGEVTALMPILKAGLDIHVFPTIFQDYVNIEIADASIESTQFNIYDITGRDMKSGVLNKSKTITGLSYLEKGAYILKLTNMSKSYSVKILKQ